MRRIKQIVEFVTGVLVVGIIFGWLALLGDRIIMPLWVGRGLEIEVSDFHLMPVTQADSIARELRIELAINRHRIVNHLPAGTVLDQYPVAGSQVKPGRIVEIVRSIQDNLVSCPAVVGNSPREAALIADSAGLQIAMDDLAFIHSIRHPEGVVIKQDPEPMQVVERESSIRLTVSLGEPPKEVKAPDLIGRNLDDVEFLLMKNYLRVGRVTRFPDRSVAPGTVLSQEPGPGSKLGKLSTVDVRISSHPRSEAESVADSAGAVETDGSNAAG